MINATKSPQALVGAPLNSGEIQTLAQHRWRTRRYAAPYDDLSVAAQSWERDWRAEVEASFAGAIL